MLHHVQMTVESLSDENKVINKQIMNAHQKVPVPPLAILNLLSTAKDGN
jgi:hypothetical protein